MGTVGYTLLIYVIVCSCNIISNCTLNAYVIVYPANCQIDCACGGGCVWLFVSLLRTEFKSMTSMGVNIVGTFSGLS